MAEEDKSLNDLHEGGESSSEQNELSSEKSEAEEEVQFNLTEESRQNENQEVKVFFSETHLVFKFKRQKMIQQ